MKYYKVPRWVFWLWLTFTCIVFWVGVGVKTLGDLYFDIVALGLAVISMLICVGYLDKDAKEWTRLKQIEKEYNEMLLIQSPAKGGE